VTRAPALYTREFLRACGLHFAGAMSLALFLLFPLYVKALGGSEVTIGLLLGVGTAASVLVRPGVGLLLDRVGRRRVLVWGGVANVLSWIPFFFLTAVGPGLYGWAALHEVVWGALFAAYFTYAADLAPAERRAEGIAIFGVAGMSANGLAPILGERVIDAAGFPAYLALAMLFGVVAVALSLRVPGTVPVHGAGTAPAFRDIVRLAGDPRLAQILLATAILGVAINAAYFFVAPYVHESGAGRAGPFFAAYSATSVVIRLFARRTLDVLGPYRVSGPGFVLFAAGLLALAAVASADGAGATALLVVAGMACGAGHGSLFPVLNALAVSRAPAGTQGAVVGLHTAAIDAGAVVGTPLCGVVAHGLGYPAMYAIVGLASLAGLGLMAKDARVMEEEAA
jgi:MFS family permease